MTFRYAPPQNEPVKRPPRLELRSLKIMEGPTSRPPVSLPLYMKEDTPSL